MTNSVNCAECGNPIPPDSPEGHCPNCLLQHALAGAKAASVLSKSDTITAGDAGHGPAAVEPLGIVRYVGDYELLEEVARGGMGVIYRARQVSLNRVVAVKMILAGRFASEAEVRRFHTEAEAAANLQHPNIVAIHEVGHHQGQHYFSMDYVNGPNLAQWAKGRPLSPPEAARLLLTIARAVDFAHQRGTLHRDLKPHNILIDDSGQPHITDFGLAKRTTQASQLTQDGAVMGSPCYMSPEQAVGRQDLVGPASDVYALGAILYELLAGRPPFGPVSFATLLRQVIEDDPTPPSRANRLVPADLETICLKCLEKRPERRYATARELAAEFERFLNQEPILARPAGTLRKAWHWLMRNPWLLMGGAAALILGLTGLSYGLWEQNRFLVWTHTQTAASVARPGPMLGRWMHALLILGGFFLAPVCFMDFVDRKRRGIALGPPQLRVFCGLGAFWVLGAIAFAMAMIHDWTWADRLSKVHGDPGWLFFAALVCAWFGGLLLFHVAREFRIRSLGLRPANEGELFPSTPREGRTTIADRYGLNLVLAAVLVAVWLSRLLIPDSLTRHLSLFFALIAAEIPIGLAFYRLSRKSVNRHVVLWFTAICALLAVGFLGPLDRLPEDWQGLTVLLTGLALGAVVAVGVTRLEKAGRTGPLAAPEVAWFSWWVNNPGGVGALALCLIFLAVASAALIGGIPVRPSVVVIIGLVAVLPHETVCWFRAKGLERRGRSHTVGLLALGLLSAASGVRPVLSASGAGVGLLIGLAALAFIRARSK